MKRSVQALTFTLFALIAATQIHAAGHHITGKVTASSDEPVSSVWVVLVQNEVEKGRALTGDDGKYYIGSLEKGTYTIVVKGKEKELFRGQVQLPRDQEHDVRTP